MKTITSKCRERGAFGLRTTHLFLAIVLVLVGCSNNPGNKNIYDIPVSNSAMEIVNKDQLRILISRDGNIYDPTGKDPFVNLSKWSVHVYNLRKECVSVGILWNLSGLTYVPTSVNYIDVPPNSSRIVGTLKEISTLYYDFSYISRGYGRVRDILTKGCKQ